MCLHPFHKELASLAGKTMKSTLLGQTQHGWAGERDAATALLRQCWVPKKIRASSLSKSPWRFANCSGPQPPTSTSTTPTKWSKLPTFWTWETVEIEGWVLSLICQDHARELDLRKSEDCERKNSGLQHHLAKSHLEKRNAVSDWSTKAWKNL